MTTDLPSFQANDCVSVQYSKKLATDVTIMQINPLRQLGFDNESSFTSELQLLHGDPFIICVLRHSVANIMIIYMGVAYIVMPSVLFSFQTFITEQQRQHFNVTSSMLTL